MRAIPVLTVLGLLTFAGAVGPAQADVGFRTPSKNIACYYAADYPPVVLRCDVGSGVKPAEKPPSYCTGDRGSWNVGFSMAPTGRAHQVCASDTVMDPRAKALAYGTTWKGGGFVCTSKTEGLRCTNRSGHGFSLSRDRSFAF